MNNNKYDEIKKMIAKIQEELALIDSYLPESEINSSIDWDLNQVRIRADSLKTAFEAFVRKGRKVPDYFI